MTRTTGTLLVAGLLVAGCKPSTPAPTPAPKRAARAGSGATPATTKKAASKKPPGQVGQTCRSKVRFGQGSCKRGLRCLPFPGGYCFTFCAPGRKCPLGGKCAPSIKAGDWCYGACKTNADCRAKQGYLCHPDWKVCTLPQFLVPKLKTCSAKPLPRRTFAKSKVQQLTKSAKPHHYQHEPTIALSKDGSLTIAYIEGQKRPGSKNPLGVVRIGRDGKTIAAAQKNISFGRENHFDPWITASGGKLHLVWLGFNGGRAPEKNMEIGYARSSDKGVTFKKVGAAHDADNDCPGSRPGCMDKPMIISGRTRKSRRKRAIYVFYASAVKDQLRMTRSLDGGKTFSKSVGVLPGAYASAIVDARGVIHVVSGSGKKRARINRLGDKNFGVFYARSDDGGKTFSKPVLASAADDPVPFFYSNPQVLVARDKRTIHVIYPTGTPDGRWDIVMTTSRDRGKTFAARLKLNDDAPCANHRMPQAVRDRRGRIHVAWYDNRDGKGNVAYVRCRDGSRGREVRCGKNERINDAPFATFSLVRHSPRWNGEYFGLALDEKRRRIHAVWSHTVMDRGVASSRLFHAAAKLR